MQLIKAMHSIGDNIASDMKESAKYYKMADEKVEATTQFSIYH